jgi:trigger factor
MRRANQKARRPPHPKAMQVTREELNPCTIKLSVVCDPAEVQDGFAKAFKQISKKIKLPGFRPGHAPKGMLEGLVPREELYETAAENIVRNTFKKAVEQEAIQADPSTRPSIELTLLDQEKNAAEYSAKVPLPPQVELGEYKGLPVEAPSAEVTDEEVEYQLEEFRKRKSTRESVTDRGVQEGDVAVVNVKLEGQEGEGRNFMTIAGQTFPQFDEALMGMKVEEIKSLELTFPENFQEKDWAGQTHNATVTVNSLSAVKLPELDDAFAQTFKTENVEDLRTRVRQGLETAKQNMVREVVASKLLEALLERSTIHVSDNMWEALAERRITETAEEQNKEGKTLEQYAAENGMTVEQFVENWQQRAKHEVERALAIQQVYTKEKMELTNEDLNTELGAMAQEYGVGLEEMFNVLKENQALDELQFRSIQRKVADFLLQNAEVKEVAEATA